MRGGVEAVHHSGRAAPRHVEPQRYFCYGGKELVAILPDAVSEGLLDGRLTRIHMSSCEARRTKRERVHRSASRPVYHT